ncbi:MAG: hypothetical protein JWO82_986 [Akkermansiaceae bacterium]|nr:hypothetical protein [Akkermansiaceae bacterium]
MLWVIHLANPLVLVISRGSVRLVKGKAPASLLRSVQEVADLSGLTGGCLFKNGRGHWGFSLGVPEEVRQRFRNVLANR